MTEKLLDQLAAPRRHLIPPCMTVVELAALSQSETRPLRLDTPTDGWTRPPTAGHAHRRLDTPTDGSNRAEPG
ncbi:unnamed protein product [Nesidiocoris tenuis]|uniref:Uncharacterized protein n=1 Tax=Nesidiocoris tenuis TaxID=355587 RepID=A0A6H5H8V5_9HEMI|nr:unnamed protein product [Nesidiocoris tenuis]